MDKDLKKLLEDESEDALLARIQEESLRYYNEVELPRRAADRKQHSEAVENVSKPTKDKPQQPHCSKTMDINKSPLKDVFYKGTEYGAEGFHLAAGETYVYPTNYPIRKYQKSIIHSALFHNTLVSLPTGLGKTFIGAVVMYNYYRWFPQGKIVFMAPTKPLVAQQIRACHSIMAIPIKDTIEMTGTMSPVDRLQHWKTKRVFFLTPQVMANDLRSGVCPAKLFKCVVIDEAHRATKEYSFCHVIKELERAGGVFRVLALSATPGSNIKAVIEVVQNLRISTLELRGEDSPDVTPYTHAKQIEPVFLSLSKSILDFLEQFLVIFERYARTLRESRLITCNVRNLTKFQLLKVCEKIRLRPPNGMSKAKAGFLMSDLMVCITLAHGLELLQTYGIRAFYQYFTGCEEEENRKAAFTRLSQDAEFHQLMNNLQAAVSSPMDQVWSHPKHEHIVKILKEHFCRAEEEGTDTKVIIFCQYRVVVTEVYDLLQKIHPLIKPVMFIGQGVGKNKNGLPQKKQIEVMKQFREGKSNVMIATCVAEEGLDIGSVDLLMLMEVQRSPVRLVQRLGRTGRHRQGRCVVLLTKGKEVQKFNEAMAIRKSFLTNIQNSKVIAAHLYKEEPTMVPPSLMPKMQLVHINVPERITPAKSKKQSDIRQALLTKLEDNEEVVESPFLLPEQIAQVKEELNSSKVNYDKLCFTKSSHLYQRINESAMGLEELFNPTFSLQSEFNDWNRVLQQTYLISHSSDTNMLCHLLNKSETMQLGEHLDIINTQMDIGNHITNKKKSKGKAVNKNNENISKKKKSDNEKRHGMDIRECMALASDKARLTQDVVQENEIIVLNDLTNENIILSQQSTPSPYQDSNKELIKLVGCSICKPLFNGLNLNWKNQNTQPFPITLDCLTAVELLVNNLTKDVVTNININCIVSSKPIKSQRDNVNYHNFNHSNLIEPSLSLEKTGVNETFNTRLQTIPTIQRLDKNISSTFNNANTKLLSQNVIMPDENPEFFNLEDIFNEDDDFDVLKLDSKTFPKNSTPIKEHNLMSNGKMNNYKLHNSETKHHYISDHSKQLCDSNTEAKLSSINKTNIFKIPQLKLNFQTLKSPHREINKIIMSPESPILSGQISNCNNSSVKLNFSNKVPSPESPVLSGQVLNQKMSLSPKLERKVLFYESGITKVGIENDTSLCKPLDNLSPDPALLEQDETSLLSASELFDDDSGDENKKVHLEQSSMYTISQMVTKVRDMVNKENPKSSDVQSSSKRDNINNISKSESIEEDLLFGNIDIDALIRNTHNPSSTNSANTKESLLNDETSFKHERGNNIDFSPSKPNLVIITEAAKKENGTSLHRTQFNETKFKTSTPYSSAKRKPKSLNDLNSNTDILSMESKNMTITANQLTMNESSPNVKSSLNKFNYNNPNSEMIGESSTIDQQVNQDSFITTRWLSYMKSPSTKSKSITSMSQIDGKGNTLNSDSDSNSDVFQSPLVKKKNIVPTKPKHFDREVNKKKLFIELEADVSGSCCSSDEENTSGLDELDESFINDLTQQVGSSMDQTAIDMQARYLQSVKSPVKKICGYKIPVVSKSKLEQDIFSQVVEEDNDSYENDSFCCDATEIPADDDPSLLEIAEQILEKNKKSRKLHKRRKRISSSESGNENLPVNPKKRLKKKQILFSESSPDSPIEHKKLKRKRLLSSSSSDEDVSLRLNERRKNKKPHLLTSDSDSDRTI